MDELTLDGKIYISSKRSAQITGYAKDYVGQLCREGRVEARLVGRNWYVLEKSIMAHRFGESAEAKQASAESQTTPAVETPVAPTEALQSSADPLDSWKAATYVPEITTDITLTPTVKDVPAIERPVPSSDSSTPVIQQMQSAWHDWFSQTDQLRVSEETLLEEHYDDSPVSSGTATSPETPHTESFSSASGLETFHERAATPISLQKVTEVIQTESKDSDEGFGKEVSVPITRNLPRPVDMRSQTLVIEPAAHLGDANIAAWEGKKELRQGSIKDRSLQNVIRKPSLVLQALFVSVAILAVAIALLGTGKLDNLLINGKINYTIVHFLGGESSFTRD